MEISKEYLDKQFAKLVTKDYFEGRLSKLVTRDYFESEVSKLVTRDYFESEVSKLSTKAELKAQTKELKDYVHQSFEAQQVYIDVRFDELLTENRIKEQLTQHEYWIDKIAKKVDVKLTN